MYQRCCGDECVNVANHGAEWSEHPSQFGVSLKDRIGEPVRCYRAQQHAQLSTTPRKIGITHDIFDSLTIDKLARCASPQSMAEQGALRRFAP
jgi:hypothetical protein